MAVLHITTQQHHKQNIVSSYTERIHTKQFSHTTEAWISQQQRHILVVYNMRPQHSQRFMPQRKCSKNDGGIESAESKQFHNVLLECFKQVAKHGMKQVVLHTAAHMVVLLEYHPHVSRRYGAQHSLKLQQHTLCICIPPHSYLDYGMSLKFQGWQTVQRWA